MVSPAPPKELLIVSITPQNLERGVLWYKENFTSIKSAQKTNIWWKTNSSLLEPDLQIKPSELINTLIDFGYERAQSVMGRGLFAVRGGTIEIWPINTQKSYIVEFRGNVIASIYERPPTEEKTRPKFSSSRTISALPMGSFVVHQDHGLGKLIEVIKDKNDPLLEYYVVEYAPPSSGGKPDKLYVPTNQKDRLSPYVGFETPRIHRLGGTLWQNTKRKIKEGAEKLARELLDLYVKRGTAERKPHEENNAMEDEFRSTFPFKETEDQLRAEKEILKDLSRPRPMDRILCGDVGFGKTELALRAALRVISSGQQVALLAPTTILAEQHLNTAQERFKNLPIKVAMLSRLTPHPEIKSIIKQMKTGVIDLLIGTHKILSSEIDFKNLGMVIIDEEQRFGVKQKERFKKLRAAIDILSLSATPIPRTMQFALTHLRDISLIETPPPERLPIITHVLPHTSTVIGRALAFEIKRGGQIYFLHNRIETLGATQKWIYKILTQKFPPEADPPLAEKTKNNIIIGEIHGHMKEKEIIKIMEQFRNKKIQVLLATTIIENGIDISSANTLIVDDATRLGLAQAHQLRGRVGRGLNQAFAYFLYKPSRLSEKAADRLKALQEFSELGSGYQLALRDLEIRGAGNILGREQSGAINKVGLNLYYQILGEAIEEIK